MTNEAYTISKIPNPSNGINNNVERSIKDPITTEKNPLRISLYMRINPKIKTKKL